METKTMSNKYKSDTARAFSDLASLPNVLSIPGTVADRLPGSNASVDTDKRDRTEGKVTYQQAEETAQSPKRTVQMKSAGHKPSKGAISASPSIPTTLKGKDLWEQFVNLCEDDKQIRKDLGRKGTAKLMRVENDIIETFQQCRVNDNTITTMINSVLRSFLLHYKSNFIEFRAEQSATVF